MGGEAVRNRFKQLHKTRLVSFRFSVSKLLPPVDMFVVGKFIDNKFIDNKFMGDKFIDNKFVGDMFCGRHVRGRHIYGRHVCGSEPRGRALADFFYGLAYTVEDAHLCHLSYHHKSYLTPP
jgi:hypothetical protein